MSSPQHPVNRNIAQSVERDSMRAICRIIWLVLCVALICAALPGSARVRHKRVGKYRAYGQYRRVASQTAPKPLAPVAFTWPTVKPPLGAAKATTLPASTVVALETTPVIWEAGLSTQITGTDKPKPARRARVEEFAPLVSVVSSAIMLLAVLWLVGMTLRELRRARAAGFVSRGSVEVLGSAELEPETRAYFVRVEGRILVLTADTRHGGLAVALVPEAVEPASTD